MKHSTLATSHTSGPWFLDGPFDILIDTDNWAVGMMVMSADSEKTLEAFPIARVTGPSYFGREDACDPELLANARLIAAAPDLLQRCRMCLGDAEAALAKPEEIEGYNWHSIAEDLRAVIAKATGNDA